MIDFSRTVKAMKELQTWRFVLMWLWLMVIGGGVLATGIAKVIAAIPSLLKAAP